MLRSLVSLLLLSGCASLASYQPQNAEEGIKIVKEANGTGCFYQRITGTTRPYADVEVKGFGIFTVGKGQSYLECMKAAPEAAKMMEK